jgi:hypothetical protein
MLKQILYLAYLLPLSLYAEIQNPGFENWDTTFVHSSEYILEDVYDFIEPLSGVATNWYELYTHGNCRTTDSNSGDYAFIVHNWYSYGRGYIKQTSSIDYRPNYLNGYYKYNGEVYGISGLMARGFVEVSLTSVLGDTIGYSKQYLDTISDYTAFEVPVNYYNSETPDSIHIRFGSAEQDCVSNLVCNLLYIDDLDLAQNSILSLDENSINSFQVFPNPASIQLTIDSQKGGTIKVFNVLGEKVLEQKKSYDKLVLDIESLTKGVYFIELNDSFNKFVKD